MLAKTPLEDLSTQLEQACDAASAFSEDACLYRAPIIDANETYGENDLAGFRKFRGALEKERIWVKQLAESERSPENPSTNAPYLLAVWEEIRAAPLPLTGVNKVFPGKKEEKLQSAKIEVVAAGGAEWHKVDTVKVNRLLIEFREQDSYINSDYDSSDSDCPSPSTSSSKDVSYPFTPVNSLTKQCYSILQIASHHKLRSGQIPKIVYHFTRMSEKEDGDPRVQETFECIRGMGIDLRFGSVQPSETLKSLSKESSATLKLNLDLSLLIALVSDISHAPLPATDSAADDRFRPLPQPWKKSKTDDSTEVELGALEHCRALSTQLKQEMAASLIDDLKTRIGQAVESAPKQGGVEFWTTEEAKERCVTIVNKIGGMKERRRAARLLGTEKGEDGFWAGSRHEGRTGSLGDLNIRIYPESPLANLPPVEYRKDGLPSFGEALAITCQNLLALTSEHNLSVPAALLSPMPSASRPAGRPHGGKGSRQPNQPPPAPKLHVPTPHTIRSLLEGARRGMTTITANRMSVKQIVRAMGPLEGIRDGEEGTAIWVVEPKTLGELKRCDLTEEETRERDRDRERGREAAVWVMEPRSLAENLETKLVNGVTSS